MSTSDDKGHHHTEGIARASSASSGDMPDRLSNLEQTHANIDVIRVTQGNPYSDINFIGTYLAALLGCVASFGTYLMPVTSLSILNTSQFIGPSANSTWVALAWTLLSAVSFTLIGRLSDIFGRRWFFAGSTGAAVIGSIIGATANRIDTLIAASVFLGFASAGQLSINYSVGELVPMRHRFAVNGIIFLATLPTSALSPWIARLFIEKTDVSWRGIYYLGIALHGTSFLLWVIFYHPPRFNRLHQNRTKLQELHDMDFGGIFLFIAGALLFLLGISWGGGLHPWKSAHVLCTIIIGFLLLVAFVLYELFMPLRRPLIPMHLFNYGYSTFNILSAVGGIVYYSMTVVFPVMVATLFETDIVRGGLVSCAVGGGVCAGQFFGSWLAVPGGHLKYKLIFVTAGMMGFLAGLAGATDSEKTAVALAVMAGLMVGLLELAVSTAVTIVIDDQSEIGTAAGVFGSIRAASGVLATAIYVSVLDNKVKSNTKAVLVPALIKAGLPLKSLEPFLEALASGQKEALVKVPGVTPTIIQTALVNFRNVYAMSFKTVFLATLAFSGLSFIVSFLVPNIDDKLSRDVVRRLGTSNETLTEKTSNNVDSQA